MGDSRLFTFLLISGSLILLYIIYLIFSFSFMGIFKKKIKIGKQKLNILLFQKASALYNINTYLDNKIEYNEVLNNFFKSEFLKKYEVLEPSRFRTIYLSLDDYYDYFKKNINSLDQELIKLINNEFSIIEDTNQQFFSTSQLYNSDVIGYNYWRNLFFTKWIKNLFRIKNIDTIN